MPISILTLRKSYSLTYYKYAYICTLLEYVCVSMGNYVKIKLIHPLDTEKACNPLEISCLHFSKKVSC